MGTNKMILIDTNILIEVYRNNKNIIETVQNIGQHNIAISTITYAELLYGSRNKKELHLIHKDISTLTVLNIDEDVSIKFIELIAEYALSHKLAIPDALIAATAICNNLPLYTLNKKDFQFINSIELIN